MSSSKIQKSTAPKRGVKISPKLYKTIRRTQATPYKVALQRVTSENRNTVPRIEDPPCLKISEYFIEQLQTWTVTDYK